MYAKLSTQITTHSTPTRVTALELAPRPSPRCLYHHHLHQPDGDVQYTQPITLDISPRGYFREESAMHRARSPAEQGPVLFSIQ
ncbi:hypothetical protein HNY73_021714 [Argiope bruennichi]|uniref:Uncharacterized protein n=1 Tax=Argiope bruennichi TaxID=94029 RepID=A0A8T0DZD7_ARGBR|nr:hypothetical protein HNY73_021714 [Argiope bruennichi]